MAAIWIDADACPRAIREIIVKGATRTHTAATFVANHALPIQRSVTVSVLCVPQGADAADRLIVERANAGDLVITADLPLAHDAIEKGALVITPRGEPLDRDNIKARLGMRDFFETLRASGEHTGGQKTLGERDIRDFANAFDRLLTRISR
ncbi:YaiI/YqxD family protein [Carnimonas nigrificans]|uniref:YaiI/YqxD family protein n=1 Tax=Carnimonas nigrificans TaxID=64323 RepID=UPI000471C436|nr:YaiI/YqxD family protein [Carnimonas nigrificans]